VRLLLDINIILDVALKRRGEARSASVIASCGGQHEAWLAWHSVATLAYLMEKQHDVATAREFVTGLLSWARVATTGHEDAQRALDLDMADFEDALQVAAALACGARYVITRNVRDFGRAPIPALTPEEFLLRHSA
jgi:hypothetical protein